MAKKNTASTARQLILNFCLLTIFTSIAFSFISFMFLFDVEDRFLERDLRHERERLSEAYRKTGSWGNPEPHHMRLYPDPADLPQDLKRQLPSEPITRSEFYGDEGRHYHIARLPEGAILVAEVKNKLIVRPLRKTIIGTYGAMIFILIVMACFIAYRLARRATLPLTNLAQMVQGSNPEQLPEQFARDYPDNEIGTLAAALEKALWRIRCFIQREQQFNRDVSHDLRTPITVVAGAVEILNQRHQLTAGARALVRRIAVANQHMERTVEALLSLAREEDIALLQEAVKVLPVVDRTILQLGHLLENKPVYTRIAVGASDTLRIQPGVLEILLANLLGNAFAHIESGYVSIALVDNRLVIGDTAGGVDSPLRETMFREGVKGENSSGFGMGLAIVRRICAHHKIALSVEHNLGATSITLSF